MLLACVALACQKEDGITPGIGYENLYTVVDDLNDSIQHKRYEIYTTYGVPVFFNDTIGKVFVKVDVNGDSVFRYETLDLNWTFSGTDAGAVTYQVTPLTDPDMMMKSLRFAEMFLDTCQPALYPYAMWLADKCWSLSSAGVVPKTMISRYRNLLFADIRSLDDEDMLPRALAYRNEVVKLKVSNFSDALASFSKISDEKAYDKSWPSDLYPDKLLPYWEPAPWNPLPLAEEWEQDSSWRNLYMKKHGNNSAPDWPEGVWTDEMCDEYVRYCRELVGAYGFLGYHAIATVNRRYSPKNPDADLDMYLMEMLKYPRKEFLARWEGSPLVIKKYEILYAIIRDELGVEL